MSASAESNLPSDSGSPLPKVAVYVCHCGGNIADTVDVKKVAAEMAKYPGVVVSREFAFMCSSSGQDLILDDIAKRGVERVVVAACAPSLHELTFRDVLQRAGVNPYLYEHVNIREQVSWVHKADHDSATAKAIKLTQAGVEKVSRQEPLHALRVAAKQSVAVIGGGPAGMKAALSVAAKGIEAVIIEKAPRLGGKLRTLGRVFPSGEDASEILKRLENLVAEEKRITTHTSAEIDSVSGFVGNFSITIKRPDGSVLPLTVGAVIVATGFEHYQPNKGEFGYGEAANVITLPELIALLKNSPAGRMECDGKEVKSLAMIHCVGSRQVEGIHQPQADGKVNDYCSRVCCSAALYTAKQVKDKYPAVRVYDIYRDIRAYGMQHEGYYEDVSKAGVVFFRHTEAEQPVVKAASGGQTVKVKDVLTWNEDMEMQVDLVVLVTGMMPSDTKRLTSQMKLAVGADRFLQEVHPKLRPVEMAAEGVFVAGAAQAPMDITEAVAAGAAAAAKAAILLAEPEIPLQPFVAVVDENKCTGSGLCLDECSYQGALVLTEANGRTLAQVNPALCKGCGACVAVCPSRAINVAGWTLDQFDAMVDAIANA